MALSGHDKDTRFWDKAAPKYASSAMADMAGFERSVARVKDYLTWDSKVLEVGCGTGTLALMLADSAEKIIAADLSPQMIAIAKDKARNQGVTSIVFDVAQADTSSFEGRDFDVALAFNLLHLVDDLPSALKRLHASLKPGGLLISKTPALRAMNPLIGAVVVPVLQMIGKAPSVNVLSALDIEQSIMQAGFDILAVEYHGTKGKQTRPFIVARKAYD